MSTWGREDIASDPDGVRGLPSRHGRVCFNRLDLQGFVAEIRAAGSQPVVLPLGGELGVSV